MGITYEEYLDKGTRKIMELSSSADMSAEERYAIASAFADELTGNIGNTEGLRNYDLLIYAASVRFVDEKISEILMKDNATFADNEEGIKYCTRQLQSFALFTKNGWSIPNVKNASPEKCIELLQKRQELQSIRNKILEEDKQIDELLILAEKELSVSICNQLTSLVNDLEQDVSFCEQKRIAVPVINNNDSRKLLKRVEGIRKKTERKESIYKKINSTDMHIHSIVSNPSSKPEQWRNLISLCQKQSELFSECMNWLWPIPAVRYTQLEKISEQYRHYIEMANLDNEIMRERASISTNQQYKEFFNHCNIQKENISICVQNSWDIPNLANPNPESLINAMHAIKSREDRRRRFKHKLYKVGALLVAIAIFAVFRFNKYKEGKIKVPFDAAYVIGQEQNDIYKELKDAGFKNISRKQNDSGWLENNHVISVTIDNSDRYHKGSYRKPDASVIITYSGGDRVYVTNLLDGWQSTEYYEIENILKDAGFTNISLKEEATFDRQADKLTASITLDGNSYTNENCYLSKNAPIIISYYSLQIGIGNDNSQFIGQDYEEVVESLKDSGFTNVQTQQVTTGWAKENTVVGVTVNNVDTYNSNDSFAPNVKIVVKYSSKDRVDITDILENWQDTDYEELVSSLKEKGFTTIKVTSTETEIISLNGLVAGIKINDEEFIAGECYLPKSASIMIEYYHLQIEIGQTAKQFEKNQNYVDVVKQLQSQGFINISLKRANDIGWFPVHDKEGTIKTFTIDGSREFMETDKFSYDAEIIIVVHTRKDEGCEDITEIAE